MRRQEESMTLRTLNQELLGDREFWNGKKADLPRFDRQGCRIRSICFSAGRMAFGHTGDILQDILDADPSAGRPDFEKASGVIMEPSYDDIKKYEDMKLRILNMSHSLIAGIGVLLGYRGRYGICRAMQDPDITALISRIIAIVQQTIENPKKMDCGRFAADSLERLRNPNIPDDPMRIALNGSTKMKPRFMDTWFAGKKAGLSDAELDAVLLPVAGFLRYTLGVDDDGRSFGLEDDPLKDRLASCGRNAKLGDPASAAAFRELIASPSVMGADLYAFGTIGARLQEMTGGMLEGTGAVRSAVRKSLR